MQSFANSNKNSLDHEVEKETCNDVALKQTDKSSNAMNCIDQFQTLFAKYPTGLSTTSEIQPCSVGDQFQRNFAGAPPDLATSNEIHRYPFGGAGTPQLREMETIPNLDLHDLSIFFGDDRSFRLTDETPVPTDDVFNDTDNAAQGSLTNMEKVPEDDTKSTNHFVEANDVTEQISFINSILDRTSNILESTNINPNSSYTLDLYNQSSQSLNPASLPGEAVYDCDWSIPNFKRPMGSNHRELSISMVTPTPLSNQHVSDTTMFESRNKKRKLNDYSALTNELDMSTVRLAETARKPSKNHPCRFRDYQSEQWTYRFQELLDFKKKTGHCSVPHTFDENPALARWVKRQRYQYKLLKANKLSALTNERVSLLDKEGFIWDAHDAAWRERLKDLKDYQKIHGHCNVPSTCNKIGTDKQCPLATWVKCQRRQYKFFHQGKPTNMTLERIKELEDLGFQWKLRG